MTDARKAWEKENTRFIGLKLMRSTDADIIAAVEGKNMQAEIKRLVRIGLRYDTAAENAAYSRGFFCSNCGTEEVDPEEYKYCPNCGRKIAVR